MRRSLEIPNPISQFNIVELCSKHWRQLRVLSSRSMISLTRPVLGRDSDYRSLTYKVPRNHWNRELIARMPAGRVTLKTDISQFYSSKYTHAIDWGIRGKDRAKSNIHSVGLGPELDKLIRNSRNGETIGLSVGPDTSWLASEVLMARIDSSLALKFPETVRRSARISDDMTVFAKSVREAEDLLAEYQMLLQSYGLNLNPIKVKIYDGFPALEPRWVRTIRGHRYRDTKDSLMAADIVDLFNVAFEARDLSPSQGVLNYAVLRCNPFPAGKESWPIYRDLLLSSISIEPTTLPNVCAVLEFAYTHGLPFDKDRISEVFNSILLFHARLGHGFETSWILHTIRNLNLNLDSEAARLVADMEDNCSIILLHDIVATSKSLQQAVSFEKAVKRAERSGALSSSDWLLAYEFRHNRLCRPNKWDGIATWQAMHNRNIKFFDPKYQRSSTRLKRSRPQFVTSWPYGP